MSKSTSYVGIHLQLDGSDAEDVSRWVIEPGKMTDPTLWWSASAYSNWTCESVPTNEGVFFVVFSDKATGGVGTSQQHINPPRAHQAEAN